MHATGAEPARESAASYAYQCVRDLIVTVALRPGEALREEELQERLGVGRTPLREALLRIAGEGMLQVYPRRAIVVAQLGLQQITQVYEARLVIEPDAAALAAERVAASELTELRALAERMQTVQVDEAHALSMVHRAFHTEVARCARNAYLFETIERLLTLDAWIWNVHFESRGRPRAYLPAHLEIVGALAARDAPLAERLMREHILSSKGELLAAL